MGTYNQGLVDNFLFLQEGRFLAWRLGKSISNGHISLCLGIAWAVTRTYTDTSYAFQDLPPSSFQIASSTKKSRGEINGFTVLPISSEKYLPEII